MVGFWAGVTSCPLGGMIYGTSGRSHVQGCTSRRIARDMCKWARVWGVVPAHLSGIRGGAGSGGAEPVGAAVRIRCALGARDGDISAGRPRILYCGKSQPSLPLTQGGEET